jgi:hypothetical protein
MGPAWWPGDLGHTIEPARAKGVGPDDGQDLLVASGRVSELLRQTLDVDGRRPPVDTEKHDTANPGVHGEQGFSTVVTEKTGTKDIVDDNPFGRIVQEITVQNVGMERVHHVTLVGPRRGKGVFPNKHGRVGHGPSHVRVQDLRDELRTTPAGHLESKHEVLAGIAIDGVDLKASNHGVEKFTG